MVFTLSVAFHRKWCLIVGPPVMLNQEALFIPPAHLGSIKTYHRKVVKLSGSAIPRGDQIKCTAK
jgi:hypothetical protein